MNYLSPRSKVLVRPLQSVTRGGEWVPNEQLAAGLESPLERGTQRNTIIQLLEFEIFSN
jgi:hypothetical protein